MMVNTEDNYNDCKLKESLCAIKAVIFDLDGTLLDTESLSDQAILAVFDRHLPSHIDRSILPWECKRQLLGLRGSEWTPIMIDYAHRQWNIVRDHLPSPGELWVQWENHLNEYCKHVELCQGAMDLVNSLSKHKIPMAIATSSRAAAVARKRLRHEDIFSKIQVIVTGDDPAVKNGKPAPDMYIEAAKRLNVEPNECLAFEDSLSGVKSAGCFVLAVPDARFDETDRNIFAKEANVVISTLSDFDANVLK
jgi:beta-phosphoglucomutase-like phosphatase (HAD superfamily)